MKSPQEGGPLDFYVALNYKKKRFKNNSQENIYKFYLYNNRINYYIYIKKIIYILL